MCILYPKYFNIIKMPIITRNSYRYLYSTI
nr:MAG TPA: hypothetical protein [Caudoviricetes sp.]